MNYNQMHYDGQRDVDSYDHRADNSSYREKSYRDDRHRDHRSYRDDSRDRKRDGDRNRDKDRSRDDNRVKHRDSRRSRDRRRSRSPNDSKDSVEKSTKRRGKYDEYYIDWNNRATLWDVPPPGYENMPVSEFKQLKATGALPVMALPNGALITKKARRLYIGGIPPGIDEDDIMEFFNKRMIETKMTVRDGNPVILCILNDDMTNAILEFRTAEETTDSLSYDGANFNGSQLTIRRPKDYIPPGGVYYGLPQINQDALNKLFVACIPVYLNDDQVKELMSAFGELKGFNLVKDGTSGLSKGYAFCEFRDPSVTDLAIAGLNGMQIADKKLVVQRAVLGSRHGSSIGGIIPATVQVPGLDPTKMMSGAIPTEILCLMNMVDPDELRDDEEYEDLIEDIKTECSKFGEVISVEIPRPHEDYYVPGLGKIYIEFANSDQCKLSHNGLAGRKFAGRMVMTSYFDVDKYRSKDF